MNVEWLAKRRVLSSFCFGLAGLLGAAGNAVAHDFTIDIINGVDSNPNKLTDTLDLDNGAFSETRFELSHTPGFTGYYYEVHIRNTDYVTGEETTSEDNTEELDANLDLGWKWRPKTKNGRATYRWEVNVNRKDSVYVDRSTGDVKTWYDVPIGERFDATWVEVKTNGKVPLSEDAKFVYELKVKDKDYYDYQDEEFFYLSGNPAPPPSNLDYQQADLELGFEKEIWPNTQFENSIVFARRNYTDRRAKDEDGNEILNSDLSYRYLEAKNGLDHRIAKRWKFKWGLNVYQRLDNEDGYYDSLAGKAYMRLRYRNGDYVRFTLGLSYNHRRYDNAIDDVNAEEESGRRREGFRFEAELIRRIVRKKFINLDVIIGARYEDFDNSNLKFAYDRGQIYGGIRWQPF
ncbi:hypothetical protein NBRC116494_12860 [Aurantivibrio plasticivorans]